MLYCTIIAESINLFTHNYDTKFRYGFTSEMDRESIFSWAFRKLVLTLESWLISSM